MLGDFVVDVLVVVFSWGERFGGSVGVRVIEEVEVEVISSGGIGEDDLGVGGGFGRLLGGVGVVESCVGGVGECVVGGGVSGCVGEGVCDGGYLERERFVSWRVEFERYVVRIYCEENVV